MHKVHIGTLGVDIVYRIYIGTLGVETYAAQPHGRTVAMRRTMIRATMPIATFVESARPVRRSRVYRVYIGRKGCVRFHI